MVLEIVAVKDGIDTPKPRQTISNHKLADPKSWPTDGRVFLEFRLWRSRSVYDYS